MKLRKIAAIGAATAVLAGAGTSAAFAADPTDVTVSGASSLAINNPAAGNFGAVTLDGSVKTTSAAFENISATDARGTGAGWNVTVQGTRFAEHDGTDYVASGRTLPTSSLAMAAVSITKSDSTSSTEPTATAGPYTLDSGSAVKISSAAADGSGMGSYTFTQGDLDSGTAGVQPLKLTVPASAYAKTYRSDVTVSIVSGP